jgi:hypothetical protein
MRTRRAAGIEFGIGPRQPLGKKPRARPRGLIVASVTNSEAASFSQSRRSRIVSSDGVNDRRFIYRHGRRSLCISENRPVPLIPILLCYPPRDCRARSEGKLWQLGHHIFLRVQPVLTSTSVAAQGPRLPVLGQLHPAGMTLRTDHPRRRMRPRSCKRPRCCRWRTANDTYRWNSRFARRGHDGSFEQRQGQNRPTLGQ